MRQYLRLIWREVWATLLVIMTLVGASIISVWQGGLRWLPWYIVVVLAVVVAAGYKAYTATTREYEERLHRLQSQLDMEREKEPSLEVRWSDEGELVKELALELEPPPSPEELDCEVAAKREKMLKQWEDLKKQYRAKSSLALEWKVPNLRFPADLDCFLPEYRAALEQRRKAQWAANRIITLRPVLVNAGQYPADDIQMSIKVPEPLRLPTEQEEDWQLGDLPELPKDPPTGTRVAATGPRYRPERHRLTVEYRLGGLAPGVTEDDFEAFELSFACVTGECLLEFDVRIAARQLKAPVNEKLRVHVLVGARGTHSSHE